MQTAVGSNFSIIIVSFNTRQMTLACLRSIYAQALSSDFEIVLVDNASEDGSVAAIREEFPQVRLLAEAENHGFARANNLAAEYAQGDYLLLLNPDTLVLDHAIDRLLDFARDNQEANIWGGRTVFADGSLNPTSCWRRMTLWNLFCRAVGLSLIFPKSEIFNPESYGGWQRDSVRRVDIVTGCLFLIKREMWVRLGGFAPAFFMYGEEADLCLRARKIGCRPMITPEATIVHYGGASEKTRAGKLIKLLTAKVELVRRHFPIWQRGAGVGLLMLWVLTRYAGYSFLALLSHGQSLQETADSWGASWRHRRTWLRGYAEERFD